MRAFRDFIFNAKLTDDIAGDLIADMRHDLRRKPVIDFNSLSAVKDYLRS